MAGFVQTEICNKQGGLAVLSLDKHPTKHGQYVVLSYHRVAFVGQGLGMLGGQLGTGTATAAQEQQQQQHETTLG